MKKKIIMLEDEDEDEDIEDDIIENNKIVMKKSIVLNEYHINLDQDISSPEIYRNVFNTLRNAIEGEVIYLNINSFGGYIHSMIHFVDCLLTTKAKTVANIYTAYSAAAVIALSCDILIFKPFSSLMVHSLSTSTFGKIGDVHGYTTFASKQDKEIANIVYTGFLTKEEIKAVAKGKDMWMDREECIRRLKNWKSLKSRCL